MNCNFAKQNEYLISIWRLGPGSLPYLRKWAENFSATEQNSSRIRVSEQNFEQNKWFLRALPAGRISHFTSRIYPSLILGHTIYCWILCTRCFNTWRRLSRRILIWYNIKLHCFGETSRNRFLEAVKNEGEDNLHSVNEKARNSASHKKRLLLQIGGKKRARFSV